MDEDEKAFARRYRDWIDRQPPDRAAAAAVWKRIAREMELSQGPPPRAVGGLPKPDPAPSSNHHKINQ